MAPDYVLVIKDKADALIAAFKKTLDEFYGKNAKESQSYGRIINTRQFDRLQRILDSIDQSKIVVGGETDREDLYIAPTIVSPVDADDPYLMQDEIFGPILPVVTIQNLDEAVNIINAR